jgi:hypothetical protein
MVTNEKGGLSSSTHNATRLSRPMAFPLIVSTPVVKITSSPSSTNQIGMTWGRPSLRTVASLPVRVPSITNACHCSRVIEAMRRR